MTSYMIVEVFELFYQTLDRSQKEKLFELPCIIECPFFIQTCCVMNILNPKDIPSNFLKGEHSKYFYHIPHITRPLSASQKILPARKALKSSNPETKIKIAQLVKQVTKLNLLLNEANNKILEQEAENKEIKKEALSFII